MIKTSEVQQAYQQGRQAAMVKLATLWPGHIAGEAAHGAFTGTLPGLIAANNFSKNTALHAAGGGAIGAAAGDILEQLVHDRKSKGIYSNIGALLGGALGGRYGSSLTGLKTTKDLPAPTRKAVEKKVEEGVSNMDTYLGLATSMGIGGALGGALNIEGGSDDAIAGALGGAAAGGLLYAPTILGSHRARRMLEKQDVPASVINKKGPEFSATAPLSTLGYGALGAGLGAGIGYATQQDWKIGDKYDKNFYDAKERMMAGAGLGGLLGVGTGLVRDYLNPFSEAEELLAKRNPKA